MKQRTPLCQMTFPYVVHTDGAKKGLGGPGPAYSGFVIMNREGKTLFSRAKYLGITTINVAEYTGLDMALDWVLSEISQDDRYVHFITDSQLMAHQLNRVYKVKHENIRLMFNQVCNKLDQLDAYKIEWKRRNHNTCADSVCSEAVRAGGFFEKDERV